MDAEKRLAILRSGFRKRQRPAPDAGANRDVLAAHAFWKWLQDHQVSLAGLTRLTQLSRSTLSSLSGTGHALKWSGVTRPTVDRLLPVLREVDPALTRQGLRQMLELKDSPAWREGEEVDASLWLTGIPLALEGDLQVNVALDPNDPAPPHVVRVGDRTVITTQEEKEGTRLGRLLSLTPA
ncbi:hypothetical protein QOL99_11850 [Deinococcus sp. MIMF12]|uniref:XRE family transcriptional regulator n=1 Tax=Deinococcus rhizophilus TaxID=3049544 RepID=A0ABT7JK20_9DEIO|nr:hypothetical protein [Deinococcus rhizophilus]MDL2344840.1 hypothetical protein [Deinococcus rhizophilus]